MIKVYALRYGISSANTNLYLGEYENEEYAALVAKAYEMWRGVKYECILSYESMEFIDIVPSDKIDKVVSSMISYRELKAYGKRKAILKDMKYVTDIAKACHNKNKALCDANEDFSQVEWSKATSWQKESAIDGVLYKLKNPEVTPHDMHDNWLKDKIGQGWVYGDVKDEHKKTHPNMVMYWDLSEHDKLKDYSFASTVDEMVNAYPND